MNRLSPSLWRRLGALLVGAVALSGCAAMAAQQKAVDDARNASYTADPQAVYSETYSLLAAKFAIAKESERRGFIETEWKEETDYNGEKTRTQVTAEVTGDDKVRVVIRAAVERLAGEQWQQDSDAARGVEDELYLSIHQRMAQASPPPG